MNNYSFEISTIGLYLSVALRIAAAVFFAIVVYKSKKAVGIKNGLIKLRKQLFYSAIILFSVNTLGMALLIIRPLINPDIFRLATDSLSLLNSLGFLIVAYLLFKIWTQQYTPEQIDRHKKIAELEVKEAKVEKAKQKE